MKRIPMALAAVAVLAGGARESVASALPAADAGLAAAVTARGPRLDAVRLICDERGCRHFGVRHRRDAYDGPYAYFRPYGYYRSYGDGRPFYVPPQVGIDDFHGLD